jgi:hypothetical protein
MVCLRYVIVNTVHKGDNKDDDNDDDYNDGDDDDDTNTYLLHGAGFFLRS